MDIKKIIKWSFIGFGGLILLTIIIVAISGNEYEQEQVSTEKPITEINETETETETLTSKEELTDLEIYALQVIEEEIGLKTNRSDYPERIKDTNIGINNVVLHLVSDDNLSVGMMKGGILRDSLKLFEEIYKYEHQDIFVVNLVWYAPLVDQYGNEELIQVIDIGIYEDTAEKINWDNVLSQNLPNVADYYTEHPALNE